MAEVRRVLLAHPGPDHSVHDVFIGLRAGLQAAGVEVVTFNLAEHLSAAKAWLELVRERWGRYPDEEEPPSADVLYQSCKGALILALEHGVDAAVFVAGLLFEPRAYILFRRAGIPIAVYGTESPYEDGPQGSLATFADLFTTNDRDSVERLRAATRAAGAGTRVAYFPAAYNPAVHRPDLCSSGPGADDALVPRHDLLFVGTYFPERVKLLEALVAHPALAGADVGLYGRSDLIPDESPLHRHVRGGVVTNLLASAMHQKAGVALNLFRTERLGADATVVGVEEGGVDVSPRVVELAALGATMVSQYRSGMEELFGDVVPMFETAEEAARLVRHYLDNAEDRDTLRASLPALVAGQSFHERAAGLLAELQAL